MLFSVFGETALKIYEAFANGQGRIGSGANSRSQKCAKRLSETVTASFDYYFAE